MNQNLIQLFRKAEALQNKMRFLFMDNNIQVGKVEFLKKSDFLKWKILYQNYNKTTKKISDEIQKIEHE